jgi:hypothetical protein
MWNLECLGTRSPQIVSMTVNLKELKSEIGHGGT